MALVNNGMPCAICGEPIEDVSKDIFALTFYGIRDRRFARLDDSACHQACIDNWHLRDEFISFYNKQCCNEIRIDRQGHVGYRFSWWESPFGEMLQLMFLFLIAPGLMLVRFLPDSDPVLWTVVGIVSSTLIVLAVVFVVWWGWLGMLVALMGWASLDAAAIVIVSRE